MESVGHGEKTFERSIFDGTKFTDPDLDICKGLDSRIADIVETNAKASKTITFDATKSLLVYDDDIPQMAEIVVQKRKIAEAMASAAVEIF